MEHVTLTIEGMSCGHCVGAVRNALAAVPGVEVENVIIGKADVRLDPSAVTREQLVDAIEDQGYWVQEQDRTG